MKYKVKLSSIIRSFILLILAIIIFYSSMQGSIYSSDEGKLWHISKMIVENDTNYALTTLMPLSSTTLYAIYLVFIGYDFNILIISGISSIFSILLFIRIIDIEYKNSKLLIFSLILFFLVPSFLVQASDLRAYALANFFIILSMYFFTKYLKDQNNPLNKKFFYLSSVFLAMPVYFQNLFLVSVSIPFFYFIFSRFSTNKIKTISIFKYYGILAVLLLPWFLPRYLIAEFDFFRAPFNWMYEEGYWQQLNIQLWNRATPRTNEYYLFFIKKLQIIFNILLPFLFLGMIRIIQMKKFLYFLYISWIIAFIIPIIIGKIPTGVSRYLYPLIIPLIIISTFGIDFLCSLKNKKIILTILSILTIIGMITLSAYLVDFESIQQGKKSGINEFNEFKYFINNGDNIFFRSHQPAPIFPENRIYTITDFSHDDAYNLITWNSEDKVEKIMEKYNIHWIILYGLKENFWERKFHSWTEIATGETPKHYIQIKNSSLFEKKAESQNFILYKYIQNDSLNIN